jgi:formate transporter
MADTSPAMSPPPEIASAISDACVEKATLPPGRMTGLGMLAGAYIGFGSLMAALLGAGAGELPHGMAQIVAGIGFALGLILVVLAGSELFTGNTLMSVPLAQRRIGFGQLLRAWGVVWCANLVGAVVVVLLALGAGVHLAGDGAVAASAIDIAAEKAAKPAMSILASGVLANVLVCLAVWMAAGAQSAVDKVVVIVPPIAAFVALGLEHSVANMSLLPLGLLAQATTGAELPAGLTWGAAGVNLLWSTIGNVIGGGGLGLAYWAVYLRGK